MQTQNYFQRLEAALAQAGRSKGALAAHLGVALSTVSNWRRATPKAQTVQETADWLGVDAKWLMTGEESPQALSSSPSDSGALEKRMVAVEKALAELLASSPSVGRPALRLMLRAQMDRAAADARDFFATARHLAAQARLAADRISDRGMAAELKHTAREMEEEMPQVKEWLETLMALQLERIDDDAPPTSSADRGDAVVAEAAEEPAAYRTNQKKA